MSSESSAQRYATALFEMARDAQKVNIIMQNASDFLSILSRSKELKTALSHPNIQRADRKRIIDGVLKNAGYDPMFSNFLRVVVERGRIVIYPRIVSELEVLSDTSSGRVRANVYVAQSMTASQKAQLKARVESQIGHEVVLQEHIEASIIGGFRLELQGRVFDNSIRRHLERLRDEMHV